MRKSRIVIALMLVLMSISCCTADTGVVAPAAEVTAAPAAETTTAPAAAAPPAAAAAAVTTIELGDTITISGDGAAVSDAGVTITAPGAYHISGTLADGMVEVNAAGGKVELVLDGATIANADGPAILFAEVAEAVVTLADGTVNALTDGGSSEFDAALYANGSLTIQGGGALDVVANNAEGISSVMHITIDGGVIHVKAVEDGLNANNDNVSVITINGGYLFIETEIGDGIDSNGKLTINGGTVIAHGALADANGGLDADGDVTIAGGTVIATGSRLSTPTANSPQQSIMVSFDAAQDAGALVAIQTAGNQVLTFAPAIPYQTLLYSSDVIAEGVSYDVYSGGQATGEAVDGLYTDAEYSGGTLVSTITTDSVTNARRGGPRPAP